MREVRYYRHRFPASYFKGKGWRGLLVRVLNFCRYKCERWCSYHVMLLLAKRHVDDETVVEALKIRWKEEQDEETKSRTTLGVFGQLEATFGAAPNRYQEGRKNGPDVKDRQETTAQIARLMRKPHQRPYTHARSTMVVSEPFEPLE